MARERAQFVIELLGARDEGVQAKAVAEGVQVGRHLGEAHVTGNHRLTGLAEQSRDEEDMEAWRQVGREKDVPEPEDLGGEEARRRHAGRARGWQQGKRSDAIQRDVLRRTVVHDDHVQWPRNHQQGGSHKHSLGSMQDQATTGKTGMRVHPWGQSHKLGGGQEGSLAGLVEREFALEEHHDGAEAQLILERGDVGRHFAALLGQQAVDVLHRRWRGNGQQLERLRPTRPPTTALPHSEKGIAHVAVSERSTVFGRSHTCDNAYTREARTRYPMVALVDKCLRLMSVQFVTIRAHGGEDRERP